MNIKPRAAPVVLPQQQSGMVLLVSLVFLLLLTLLGVSSMQNATLQEKMAGSVTVRNQSFQAAEAILRVGESAIQVTMAECTNTTTCAPPSESTTVVAEGLNGTSGVRWVATTGGFYGIQKLSTTKSPVNLPSACQGASSYTLYRVTGVGIQGVSRTVLESIYAIC